MLHGSAAAAERALHFGCHAVSIDGELTWVRLVEPTPHDLALIAALGALLAAAHRAPSQIWLAALAGACGANLAVAGGPGDAIHEAAEGAPYMIDRATATRSPFAMLRRPPLVLSIAHPLVAAAHRHTDPVLAASHLARGVLLHYRLLDVNRSAEILSQVLDRLGVT